jgi:hypothetical protein
MSVLGGGLKTDSVCGLRARVIRDQTRMSPASWSVRATRCASVESKERSGRSILYISHEFIFCWLRKAEAEEQVDAGLCAESRIEEGCAAQSQVFPFGPPRAAASARPPNPNNLPSSARSLSLRPRGECLLPPAKQHSGRQQEQSSKVHAPDLNRNLGLIHLGRDAVRQYFRRLCAHNQTWTDKLHSICTSEALFSHLSAIAIILYTQSFAFAWQG